MDHDMDLGTLHHFPKIDCDDLDSERIFGSPLSLIDPDADLDEVLKATSIGETIQLLCPKLMPCANEPRLKYRKRGCLDPEQKLKITREQNKENARRTRRRKRLFDTFLTCAIDALEVSLHPTKKQETDSSQEFQKFPPSLKQTVNNTKMSELLDARLNVLRKFVAMKCSNAPRDELWDEVCTPDILLAISCPSYRKLSELGSVRGMFECNGINAIVDDIEKRNSFLAKIFAEGSWTSEGDIFTDEIILKENSKSIDFSYEFRIFKGTSETSEATTIKSEEEEESSSIRVMFTCRAMFNEEGKINSMTEQYEVQDFMSQARRVAQSIRGVKDSIASPKAKRASSRVLLECVKKFVTMRVSSDASNEDWESVCVQDVKHVINFPNYYKAHSLERESYTYQGIDNLIEGTDERVRVMSSMVPHSESTFWTWTVDMRFFTDRIQINQSGNAIRLEYEVLLYAVPMVSPDSMVSVDRNRWLLLMQSQWSSEATFNDAGRIVGIYEHVTVTKRPFHPAPPQDMKSPADSTAAGSDSVKGKIIQNEIGIIYPSPVEKRTAPIPSISNPNMLNYPSPLWRGHLQNMQLQMPIQQMGSYADMLSLQNYYASGKAHHVNSQPGSVHQPRRAPLPPPQSARSLAWMRDMDSRLAGSGGHEYPSHAIAGIAAGKGRQEDYFGAGSRWNNGPPLSYRNNMFDHSAYLNQNILSDESVHRFTPGL